MARVILHGDPEWSGPPPEGCKWYLCHFAHKYLHFRRAEVESLAVRNDTKPVLNSNRVQPQSHATKELQTCQLWWLRQTGCKSAER